ncbi:MAG: hypothetical protein KF752_16170 [Pirellulaceae bacterium]|nr:hypothetical protein [Pirellulaceae bacterium]
MSDTSSKFAMIFELLELAERAFVCKLKRKTPTIPPQEIELAVGAWYQDRPGAEHGDGVGVLGDITRFLQCNS